MFQTVIVDVMDNILFIALDAYFNQLGKFGYIKDKDVLKLLLMAFTVNFMHTFEECMTDEDKLKIDELFMCLQDRICFAPKDDYHSLCN